MALIFCDGFDHYGTDTSNMTDGLWAEIGSSALSQMTISSLNPRTGTYSLRIEDNTADFNTLRYALPTGALSTVGMGAAFWFSNLPTSNDIFKIFDFRNTENEIQVSVVLQSTGVIAVKRGSTQSGTLLADSGTPAITAEAYTHIEAQATIDSTSGAVEVRVNGVTVVSVTNENTGSTTPYNCGQVSLGRVSGTGQATGTDYFYIDDLFIYSDQGSYNNDFIGDRRVLTLFPNADTAQSDWTRSTGIADYAMIDEADPNDETDYLTATSGVSPNQISEFALQDLPEEISTISGVMLLNRMRKTNAGDANVNTTVISGSSESVTTDHVLTEAYTYYRTVIEADPDTSAPFTPTAVDALQLKIERTQ